MTADSIMKWTDEDFHPPQQCFFCKKRSATASEVRRLFKVIRNTTGFPGYVVNYTTIDIPIPICSQCSEVHREQHGQLRALAFLAWLIAATALAYMMHAFWAPGEGWGSAIVFGMLLAVPLLIVPLVPLCVIWSLCTKKTHEIQTSSDYPVLATLLRLGWQWKIPQAKYGERKNEYIDSHDIERLNAKYQQEGQRIIQDYLSWCERTSGQTGPMRPPALPEYHQFYG